MEGVTITVTHQDGRSETRTLGPGTYVIGRESGDLVLGDPNASESHAQLDVDRKGASIVDLGSTNGTFLANGDRLVGPHTLHPQMPVRVGKTLLTIHGQPSKRGGTLMMQDVDVVSGTPPPAAEQPAVVPNAPVETNPVEEVVEVGGASVRLKAVRGEVVHSATAYSTSVSGSGGGSRAGGYVADVHITSTTTRHDALHILGEDGHEYDIDVDDAYIAVRNGNKVVLVLGNRKEGFDAWKYYLAVRNLDTKRNAVLAGGINEIFPIVTRAVLAGAAIIPAAILGILVASFSVFIGAWTITGAILLSPVFNNRKALEKAVNGLAEEVGKQG